MVRVRLLGGFQVVLPDGRVAGPWARPTARRVFQILVLREQHRIGREELTELLFPDVRSDSGANSLSKALSMARAALAPFEVIKADRDVVWLTGEIHVDAQEQRSMLRRAMALAPGTARDAALITALQERGRLLDEELYADWATEARDDLEALRSSARLTLARDRSAGHGRASTWDSLDAWRDVLLHDPSNEEACAESMRAAGSVGLRDLAVRTYQRTVAALHDLGLGPSAALQDAYSQALEEADTGPRAPELPHAGIRTFGRDAALAALRDLIGDQHRKSCGAVLVSGPAGIGKTHLLNTLGRELHAVGWLVVDVAAGRDDRRAPLAALRRVLGYLDLATAGPLVRLVAEGEGSQHPVEESSAIRRQLLDELVAHFDAQARDRPLALMIDDLQWTDLGLQEILAELAQRSREGQWALVFASRTDESDSTIVQPPAVANLGLVPLPAHAADALIRQTAPGLSDDVIATCVGRSAGNPFFAIELARNRAIGTNAHSTAPDVPVRILELLDARLARCSAEARRLLSVVALTGEKSSMQFLLRIGAQPDVDMDADTVIRTTDELVDAHLLEERPDGVRLVHPLLGDAAVARLNPARRATLHSLIADTSSGEIAARHRLAAFEAGGLREHARAAAEAGFAAGHHARRLFADEAALNLFLGGLRALEASGENDRDALRTAALDAWCQVGDIHLQREAREDAEKAYRAAMALAVSDDEWARAWSAMASLAYRVGDFEQCVTCYQRGISVLRQPSPDVRARLEADLGWTYFRLGRTSEAVAVLERAAATLDELGDALVRGHALDRLATVLGVVGRAEEGLAVMQRAFDAVGATGDERELGVLHIHRATLYKELGRYGEALADAAASLRMATASGDSYVQSVIHWVTGSIHEMRGDLSGALGERERELLLLEKIGNTRNSAMAHAARARLLRALGRPEESDEAAAAARALAALEDDQTFSDRVDAQLVDMGPTG